jgi:hypothetical protein
MDSGLRRNDGLWFSDLASPIKALKTRPQNKQGTEMVSFGASLHFIKSRLYTLDGGWFGPVSPQQSVQFLADDACCLLIPALARDAEHVVKGVLFVVTKTKSHFKPPSFKVTPLS